jgi:hypothetical protein
MSPGLEFVEEHIPWKKLPEEVFEKIGGKACARMMKAIREGGEKERQRSKKRSAEEMAAAAASVAATPSKADAGLDESGAAAGSAVSSVLATPMLSRAGSDGMGGTTGGGTVDRRTSAKKRRLLSGECATSLGRSSAHSMNSDVDKIRSTVRLMPQVDEGRGVHYVPHVSWKLHDVR